MNIEYLKFILTLWFLKENKYNFEDSFNDVILYSYEALGFTDEQIEWLENKLYCYYSSTKIRSLDDLINYVVERL